MFIVLSSLTYKTYASETTTMAIVNTLTGTGQFIFYVNTTSVGQKFLANVTVTNVTDLWNWQYLINWDPELLNISRAFIPDDNVFKGRTIVTPTPSINYTEGTVKHGAVILSGDTFTGSGTLAQLEFVIIKAPSEGQTLTCNISFSRPYGEDTFLLDSNFNTIPATLNDGQYKFIWPRPPSPTATIYIDPQRITDPSLTPSSQFSINVSIENAAYLAAAEFKLGFDNLIVKAEYVELGDIFPPSLIFQQEINNESGFVWLSVSLPPSQSPITGNGTLAKITFHVEGFGRTLLQLYDVHLTDDLSQPIPYTTIDGSFNNVLLATLSVEPSEVVDPALIPSTTFTVNVTIDDVENLYGYEFNLTFAPSILSVKTLDICTIFNETNFDSIFNVNNIAGFAWVKVTYYPPAVPITTYEPVALVSITFRVKGYGLTPISLNNTSIVNDLGEPIAHEVHHGLFRNFRRNVAVTSIVLSQTKVYQGRTVQVNVTVKNKGDLDETFSVYAYYNNITIDTLNVTSLPPGNETTVSFTLSTLGIQPCQNYTIAARASTVPNEIDLSDNYLTDGEIKVKLMGDVDENHIVNMVDIGLIVSAFGSSQGQSRWNPDADLNGSGFIDMKDVALAISNFGKACPQ
jgi:hypothetical protein